MIRTIASAASPRPTARHVTAVRVTAARVTAPGRFLLTLLLLTVLALAGTAAVGQRAAAAERYGDDIQVSSDGVAFEPGRESDEVAYVVRSLNGKSARSYGRDLTRGEQNQGWTAFREAQQAYPDGYCVVWVEVEDASNWHETSGNSVCTATVQPAEPTSTPTPTPTPQPADEETPEATPTPAETESPAGEQAAATEPTPTPTPAPTTTPSASPSATPSPSVSATPSPSPSTTSPGAALLRNIQEQPPAQAQAHAAQDEDLISPLGWVAVLGGGGLLTVGGALLLLRRLT